MDSDERTRWGVPPLLYAGSAELYEDLHPESPGLQRWVKDGKGRGWYPLCCGTHTPAVIWAEREAAEAPKARPEPAASTAVDLTPDEPAEDDEAPLRALLGELLRLLRRTP